MLGSCNYSELYAYWFCTSYTTKWASLVAQRLKHLPGMWETQVWSLGWEDPLEKAMAPHSSTLACRIPWREEPGRLKSMGSQRVGHDWATHTLTHTAFSKPSLNIWKFMVHILLKPSLQNFEHYFTSMWDGCNCAVVWAFFGIAFLWDWMESRPFPVLWPLLSFPNLLAYWVQPFHSIIF